TINFKTDNGYNFNYYIPGYTINAKQPISAIRACSTAFYTQDGVKVDKRNLSTGAVIASAAIPGGITSTVPPFAGGGNLNGNGGLDIDNCGNVYVGSGNQVIKYDANLNLLSSQPTSFAVYDVDVNSNGEVIACGYGGGQGYVQSFNFSACAQIPFVCVATPLSITSTSTPINCNGQCTASATAHPAGGTGAYTYSWNTTPSQSTQTASSLCAGTYTVSVKDGAGTSNTSVVTISQPAVITATATSTNSNCSSPSGSATVTASGGTGTLSYSWSPSGGTAATANNLSAGNYTCTVSDAKGCTKAVPITVGGASPPAVAATPVNPLCNGASTGSISLSASGGTSPYTYSWSPAGGTGATASSLPAGTYTSTVTDAMGCSKSQTITLTQPAAISASASATNASCGNSNGTASVTASGGTGTLSYSWTPSGGTAASASSLPAGTYTCTVTDANSCQKKVIVSVNSTGGPSVTMASQSNPVCNGTATGSATASVTGGTSPYTYSWSPAGGNTSSASNLPAGTYTVSVKDASNCVQTQTVTLTDPPAITGTTSSASATCGSNNGSATVSASGGTGALSYSWSPSGGTASTASSLSAGSYTCMVTDSKSCSKALVVSVTSNGGAAITLSTHSDVSCHAGNNGSASFSVSGGSAPYTYSW
ncbi:MAG TPA: hypothetical protein VGN15_03295, partial [Ktedonobacteraceae bacterium]|nr:hypothetical protein [Ktedonobacteraceae bacterium]